MGQKQSTTACTGKTEGTNKEVILPDLLKASPNPSILNSSDPEIAQNERSWQTSKGEGRFSDSHPTVSDLDSLDFQSFEILMKKAHLADAIGSKEAVTPDLLLVDSAHYGNPSIIKPQYYPCSFEPFPIRFQISGDESTEDSDEKSVKQNVSGSDDVASNQSQDTSQHERSSSSSQHGLWLRDPDSSPDTQEYLLSKDARAKFQEHCTETSRTQFSVPNNTDPVLLGNAGHKSTEELEDSEKDSTIQDDCWKDVGLVLDQALKNPKCSGNDKIKFTLLGKDIWDRFQKWGNEMQVVKTGRLMIPSLSVCVLGLKMKSMYSVYLDFPLRDLAVWSYVSGSWIQTGTAHHHDSVPRTEHCISPARGLFWLTHPVGVAFPDVKFTTEPDPTNRENYVCLKRFHAYQPRINIVELDEFLHPKEGTLVSHCFPETAFIAVPMYSNEKVRSLKRIHSGGLQLSRIGSAES